MSKQGKARRTPEQRIARKQRRNEIGAGVHRYLTPAQAASPEFATPVSETKDSTRIREDRRATKSKPGMKDAPVLPISEADAKGLIQ